MPESESAHFDDPDLKAALRRAMLAERAPDELRAGVEEMFATDAAKHPEPVRVSRSFWRQPIFGLAAAALILICIGLAAWHLEARPGASLVVASALPVSFAQDLVTRHDACCALPDHHDLKGVPDDDFRLMTQKLRDRLGFPALAAAAGDGWKFCGASASCMVGQARSAHLVFKQSGQSLSLFSVAAASEPWPNGKPPVEGERFTNMQDGHPIVSWIHDDTVYSVVGFSPDASLNLPGIAPIADHLRVAVSGDDKSGDRTTVALQ